MDKILVTNNQTLARSAAKMPRTPGKSKTYNNNNSPSAREAAAKLHRGLPYSRGDNATGEILCSQVSHSDVPRKDRRDDNFNIRYFAGIIIIIIIFIIVANHSRRRAKPIEAYFCPKTLVGSFGGEGGGERVRLCDSQSYFWFYIRKSDRLERANQWRDDVITRHTSRRRLSPVGACEYVASK